MLRRLSSSIRAAAVCSNQSSAAAAAAVLIAQQRHVRGAAGTAAAQYYPLHSFQHVAAAVSAASADPAEQQQQQSSHRDVSFAEFKAMVSNPGPLRVVYSDDYLDWYYRAFKEKLAFDRSKQLAASRNLTASGAPSSASPMKPAESRTRQLGEQVMARAQRGIERASVQHGLLDLYERGPQFPQVHIDRALDEHIPQLLDEFVLRGEVSAADVWRRALIARAMLLHNRRSYPASFEYIFKVIDECVFSKPLGLSNSNTGDAAENSSSNSSDKKKKPDGSAAAAPADVAPELLEDAATAKYPTLALARYYEYLVRKYNIQNAAEAHVLLRCHLAPDAETLLFSNPPPEEEKDSSKIGGGPDWERALAMPLPPLEALLSTSGNNNIALARVLLFAELNCHGGSGVDAFAKFPRAQSLVTRPSLSETREEHERSALAGRLSQRRHHILPKLIQFTLNTVDMRARDVNRLGRQSENADMSWATNAVAATERGGGGSGGFDGTVAGAVFNHRAVRAEVRDPANRRIIAGLRQYKQGRDAWCARPTLLFGEEQTRFAVQAGHYSNSDSLSVSVATAGNNALNPYLRASLPRFVSLIEGDRHVQLVLAMLPSQKSNDGASSTTSASAAAAAGSKVQRLVHEYARQLLKLALEFHLPKNRAVQLRATRVAASLLDTAVTDALDIVRLQQKELDAEVRAAKAQHNKKQKAGDKAQPTSPSSSSNAAEDGEGAVADPAQMVLLMSSAVGGGAVGQVLCERYVPFAERALDEHGFPTEAKFSDHARWMGVQNA